jgi:hypothetical protein
VIATRDVPRADDGKSVASAATCAIKPLNATIYDPTIDDLAEKPISIPAASAMRFSVAVNYKDGDGGQQTRWINVFDPESLASKNLLRKGDHVKITGYFRTRQCTDKQTGELQDLRVEKRKIREAA